MTDESIDAFADVVARRVIELLRAELAPEPGSPRLLTVSQVSHEFGLTEGWVYSHAEQLGAIRMGPGPRARLRFDRTTIDAALARLGRPAARRLPDRSPARARVPRSVPLLPIRGLR